jgi:hypothetical protein
MLKGVRAEVCCWPRDNLLTEIFELAVMLVLWFADHPPPSSAEVKKEYSYTSTPPLGLRASYGVPLVHWFSQYV